MLWDKYDLLILDLDGVIYIGDQAVPFAVEAINEISKNVRICAATNNASRRPEVVAEHLRSLGLDIANDEVYTSAEAGAALLGMQIEPGSSVLAIGGDGVSAAIEAAGFEVVRASDSHELNRQLASKVSGLLQGHGTSNNWWDFNLAMQAINLGKTWIATNHDLTVPIPGGFAPGNGAFVRLLQELTGIKPQFAGKPETALFLKAANKFNSLNPLVIGDRLDTDIDGAVSAGFDSLLVGTGVHQIADVSTNLPTYFAADLRVLLESNPDSFKVKE